MKDVRKRVHLSRQSLAATICALVLTTGCNGASEIEAAVSDNPIEVVADIWVDNWFNLTIDGTPVMADTTPYKTERSFNADRASFTARTPFTVAFEFRDFMENDTGLEYIGSPRQQIGDGGAIVQFTNALVGKVLKVSNSSWKCKVIHHAPIDPNCANEQNPQEGQSQCRAIISETPNNWTLPSFDDSDWDFASEFTATTVRPKGGYLDVDWNPNAKLIWSKDLELDNIVLCRTVIE